MSATIELIQLLCTEAGMIMEDASCDAVSTLPAAPDERGKHIAQLHQAGRDVAALLAAAEVVERYSRKANR
jgi:hypothetical protein